MGRYHVWTLVWIIVLLWVFGPIVDTDKTKLRATHRHRHHRHRKPPKHHHPPSVKNVFTEKYTRQINTTKILETVPWLSTETSTSLLLSNSSFPDNEIITSFANFSTIIPQESTNIDLSRSTEMPSTVDRKSSGSNDASGLVENINISRTTSLKNIFENSSEVPTEIIVDDAVYPNHLSLQLRQDETTTIAAGCSNSADTSGQADMARSSAVERTNSPKILIDTPPIVQLVRKIKRSIPSEQVEATDERSREPTLLNFDGPSIANDAEEVLDRESSQSLHKRVKRDGSEHEEIPSAFFPQVSNYLNDLEDSFALSALEVEARDSGSHRRTSRESQTGIDSSLRRLSRPKRDSEDYKIQNNNIEGHPAEFEKMSTADYVSGNVNGVSVEKIDENDNLRKASSSDLLSGRTDGGNAIVGVFGSADITTEGVEQFSRTTIDHYHSDNSSYNLDSSTSPEPTAEPEAEDGKTDTIHVDSSSQRSDNFTVKNDLPITGYRFEKTENEENISTVSSGRRKTNDLNMEMDQTIRQPDVESVSVDCSLKDNNTSFRHGHGNLNPEIVEDTANPSSIGRLVRTKRFGDRSSDPEAKEVSYASQVDDSIVVEEPYAEDNRIIDSILSKVDYRSGSGPKRSVRNEKDARLEEEETGERTPVRSKRGVSLRRGARKNRLLGERHGTNKRKKSRESREKKRHRSKLRHSKIKRGSNDPFESGTKFQWNAKFDSGDENFDRSRWDPIDPEVISPHDGRRRRMSEEEDGENFYSISNGAAGGYRTDIRDSGVAETHSEGHRDEEGSGWVVGRGELNVEPSNREKRNIGLQELKYFQNIRETDGGQKRSEDIDDKRMMSVDAVKAIRDIEQIVQELLAKVNELHGYVSEVGANGGTEESRAFGSTASSAVDQTTAEESKVVGQVISSNGSSPRPAAVNVERQPETCRKNPAALSRQSGPAKSNGRSARNLRAQRCSKKARRKRMSHRKWDRWTDWSSCSVTCGRGRQIRWRHCIRNCSIAETEMEEKACQLPACAPGKFLGIFG